GFVFQFYNLLGELSALENCMIPALLLRRPSAQARELAATALAEVGLADRMQRRPGELSGGERQRVAIARALVNGPALILADEPTGNLDPKTSEIIYVLFARPQAERGIAFLVATHNPDLARRADRGYRLVEGRARARRPSAPTRVDLPGPPLDEPTGNPDPKTSETVYHPVTRHQA